MFSQTNSVNKDLLQLLWDEFQQAHADTSPSAEEFAKFSRDYLDKNRPVGLSHATDENYQITLSNNQVCLISPALERGNLPDAGAVQCVRPPSP